MEASVIHCFDLGMRHDSLQTIRDLLAYMPHVLLSHPQLLSPSLASRDSGGIDFMLANVPLGREPTVPVLLLLSSSFAVYAEVGNRASCITCCEVDDGGIKPKRSNNLTVVLQASALLLRLPVLCSNSPALLTRERSEDDVGTGASRPATVVIRI